MGRGGSLGYDGGAKVYVGGLRYGATERDVERMFDKYGPIERIFVARRPPGFAFVHFSREEDAEEAVRRCDGRELNGHSIRVEMSHGRRTNRKAWWRQNLKDRRDSRSRSRSSSRGRDRRVRRDSRSRSRSPRRDTRSRSKSVRRDTRRSPSYSSYDAERRK